MIKKQSSLEKGFEHLKKFSHWSHQGDGTKYKISKKRYIESLEIALADQKAEIKRKAKKFIISINPFFKVDGTQQQLLQILVNNYLKEFEELK